MTVLTDGSHLMLAFYQTESIMYIDKSTYIILTSQLAHIIRKPNNTKYKT